MGWSCTAAASRTEQRVSNLCFKQTGSQNTWRTPEGEFFSELPSREYTDGRIAGKVYRMLAGGAARPAGSYLINPDGTIGRWDHLPAEWR